MCSQVSGEAEIEGHAEALTLWHRGGTPGCGRSGSHPLLLHQDCQKPGVRRRLLLLTCRWSIACRTDCQTSKWTPNRGAQRPACSLQLQGV